VHNWPSKSVVYADSNGTSRWRESRRALALDTAEATSRGDFDGYMNHSDIDEAHASAERPVKERG
jgi:hypothetical protein